MGYRLHVHKKHVIDYGKEDFNWRNDAINNLPISLSQSSEGRTSFLIESNKPSDFDVSPTTFYLA